MRKRLSGAKKGYNNFNANTNGFHLCFGDDVIRGEQKSRHKAGFGRSSAGTGRYSARAARCSDATGSGRARAAGGIDARKR